LNRQIVSIEKRYDLLNKKYENITNEYKIKNEENEEHKLKLANLMNEMQQLMQNKQELENTLKVLNNEKQSLQQSLKNEQSASHKFEDELNKVLQQENENKTIIDTLNIKKKKKLKVKTIS